MSDHTDPRKPFYLALSVANSDGTLDVENECPTPFPTEAEAIESAQDETDEHGGQYFIYLCTPLCRVHRVATIVERLDPIAERSSDPTRGRRDADG